MKTISRKKTFFVLGTGIALFSLIANPAFAQLQKRPSDNASTTRPVMFCTRFADNFGRLKDRAGEVRAKIVERRDGRIQKFKDKRNQRDEKLAEHRANADERRDDRYEGLEERAETGEQKAAVEKFKADVEAAVAIRNPR